MSGLSLRTGVSAGASFSPGVPVAATTPSAPRSISQQAYGVTSGVSFRTMPALGSVGVGTFALAAMIFIWWSLPR